jgi:hypothetical protein
MKAVVLLSVSKGIRLAFYVTRVLVAKILHCQRQLKNLKTKSNDGIVLTESSRMGLERAEGKKRSIRNNLRVVVTLSTTNSTRIAVGQRAFIINMIIRILIFCCPRECRVRGVNLAAHLHLVSRLLFFFNLRTAAFKAYCAIWLRRSNFRHQASPRDGR